MPNQLAKPNKLSDYIKTNEEYEIVVRIESFAQIRNLINLDGLLESVAKWRAYIGMPKDDVSLELAMIVEYLQQSWSHITVGEFEYAWLLAVNGKLDDCEYYGNFSPMYVAKVLNSYVVHRKNTLEHLFNRKEKDEYEKKQKENRPSPQQQADSMKETITMLYKNFIDDGEIFDPFNLLYNFLRKHKWLKVTQSDIDEAMSNAKNRYYKRKQKTAFLDVEPSRSKEDTLKSLARNYIVEKYLKNIDFDMLINNINSDLFTNLD